MYLERVKPEISDSCLIDRWYPARRRRLRRRRRRSLPGDRASWRPHTKQPVRLGHGSTTSICQPSSTLDRWVAWCRRAGTVSDLYDEEVRLAIRRSCRSIHPRPRRGCTASLGKLFTPVYIDAVSLRSMESSNCRHWIGGWRGADAVLRCLTGDQEFVSSSHPRPGRGCVRRLWASCSHPSTSTPPSVFVTVESLAWSPVPSTLDQRGVCRRSPL